MDEGGDPACYLHLVCEVCGRIHDADEPACEPEPEPAAAAEEPAQGDEPHDAS